MNDDFLEKRLRALPRREAPTEWRAEILAAAGGADKSRRSAGWAPSLAALKSLLWPHPYAWAGVAGMWVVITGLDLSGPRGEALYAVTPGKAKSSEITAEQYFAYLRRTQIYLTYGEPAPPVFNKVEPRKL